MNTNDNVYIPFNISKETLPMFHLDNIDFIEDNPDGRNTTHSLQLSDIRPQRYKRVNIETKFF